jgi:2-aminoadipate transaminase
MATKFLRDDAFFRLSPVRNSLKMMVSILEDNVIDEDGMIMQVEDIGWDARLADRTAGMRSSVIRELLKLTLQPDIISFAGGLPAPDFFPIREFDEASKYVLRTQGEVALQYSPTEGYPPLKAFLADMMSKYGIQVEPENILMTNGSQQGLDLIGKLFIDANDCIMCSRPTYLGALQAWNAYEANYCSIPLDDDGILVDEVERELKGGTTPVFIYVLPNFHNPAGTTLSAARREKLVALAREYDLVLVEDDPYGELRYEGEDLTPLFRMAPERTIYMSTFSKTLAPGIRLAWITAPKPLIARLVQAKQGADLHTGTYVQMIANDICERGILKRHVKRLTEVYRKRRNAMLDAIAEHWPEEVKYTRPAGGLFLWARTPEEIDTRDLLEAAVAEKVAYVPGFAFYPDEQGGRHAMRLNFSFSQEQVINEGIYRLGTVIKRALA